MLAAPASYTPQELFSFGGFMHDLGHGISEAAKIGKQVVDTATPIVQEGKKAWKQADPESYNQYKQYWRPASHAINDFNA